MMTSLTAAVALRAAGTIADMLLARVKVVQLCCIHEQKASMSTAHGNSNDSDSLTDGRFRFIKLRILFESFVLNQ